MQMKNFCWIIFSLILVGLAACSSEKEPEMLSPNFVVGDVSDITRMSARLSGKIIPVGDEVVNETGIILSENQDFVDKFSVKSDAVDVIDILLGDLKPATTYYYRFYASSGFSTVVSDVVKSFRTLDKDIPALGNVRMVSGSFSSITLACQIVDDGGTAVSHCGFVYRLLGSTDDWNEVDAKLQDDSFDVEIFNLMVGGEYEFYAFAMNETGRVHSETIVIRMDENNVPLLGMSKILEIHGSWGCLQGTVVDKGVSDIMEYGFCYSLAEENPTIACDKVVASGISTEGVYEVSVVGLYPNSLYYCRPYAINSEGIGYGEAFTFTTGSLGFPSLGRNYVTEVTAGSMRISTSYNDGGGYMSDCYFCYSTTNKNPGLSSASLAVAEKVNNGNGTFSIAAVLDKLNPSMLYYICPVIVVDGKPYYGDVLTVITRNEDGTEPYIGTSFSAMNFLASSGRQTLNIYSNMSWHIEDFPSWIHLSVTEGKCDGNIVVSVDENMGVEQRSASLKIVSNIRIIEVLVMQNGGEVVFVVSPTAMDVASSAYSEQIKVYSNVAWYVDESALPEWITLSSYSGSGSCDVVIDIKENNSTKKRSADIRFVADGMEHVLVVRQDCKTFDSGASVGGVTDGGEW